MTTLDIQRRLQALGFDPGPVDGAIGPTTIAAIKAFQARNGLIVDGVVGPRTLAALNAMRPAGAPPPPPGNALPPWYLEARRLMGTREVAGRAHSALIMGWARKLGIAYGDDETPWCGLFVSHCIAAALPDEPQPSNPLGARNWLKFGKSAAPVTGAVLVFSRPGAAWSGHVGFYAGEDSGAFSVLGGNQSNAVTVTRIAKGRLLGARWPSSVPVFGARNAVAAGGALSVNEA